MIALWASYQLWLASPSYDAPSVQLKERGNHIITSAKHSPIFFQIQQKHCKLFYNKMLNEHTLYDYLLQLNHDAEETFNRLIKQMAEREGVTEQLKADNQMEWVARMNNIHSRATEIVNHDIIYN